MYERRYLRNWHEASFFVFFLYVFLKTASNCCFAFRFWRILSRSKIKSQKINSIDSIIIYYFNSVLVLQNTKADPMHCFYRLWCTVLYFLYHTNFYATLRYIYINIKLCTLCSRLCTKTYTEKRIATNREETNKIKAYWKKI